MTMTVIHAAPSAEGADEPFLPERMTSAEWSSLAERGIERRVELVEGVPVVPPFDPLFHSTATHRLARLIEGAVDGRLMAAQHVPVDLTISGAAPTLRIPDLLVSDGELSGERGYVLPGQVVLVVEVVSASSRERDLVAKRRDYAAAGIPAYLVVDPRGGRLHLFDRIVDGRYADTHGRSRVDLHLPGADAPLPVTARDLLAPPRR